MASLCKYCGSPKIRKMGWRLRVGCLVRRYQCTRCGRCFVDPSQVKPIEEL